MQEGIPQISVEDVKRQLDAGADLFVLDVREPHEYKIVNIGATLIPLGEVPARLAEIEQYRNRPVAVMCRSGARSQKASVFLKQSGFENVSNVTGGILAWADKIDPSLPKY